MRIFFLFRLTEVRTRDCRDLFCQICFLEFVSVSRSDCRHQAYSPFLCDPKKFQNCPCFGCADDEHRGIKSWRRWPFRGSAVACSQIKVNIFALEGKLVVMRGRKRPRVIRTSNSTSLPFSYVCVVHSPL